MQCRKWEELGLLYCASELDQKSSRDFEEHVNECEACRKELDCYREEKKRFFTVEVLGETPSPEVDAEILRVCSNPKKQASAITPIPAFLRKAVVPLALFVIGFVSVGYIMLNMENADRMRAAAAQEENAIAQTAPRETPAVVQARGDSAIDSANDNFAKTRGTIGKGVVPVDLKNK
ncbi:MAG: hypothetical protein JW768_05570 [Chitinispirillaceae bacterium]|nr:hypothetical protein [Chitinispirillaceae bacterium]